MILIPTFQNLSADFTQEIDLNNQIVNIRLKYNVRNDFFHIQFTDPDGIVLYGIKVVPNYPLLASHSAFLNFSGDIFVVKDDEALEDNITYENFGNGWNLYYFTSEEVESWKVENGLE